MKPLSIKVKITLWYTGLIVFILAIILTAILFSTDKLLVLELQRELEDEVYDAAEDIRYRDGRLDLEKLNYFDDGIHIALYAADGRRLAGQSPAGLSVSVPFQSERLQTAETDGGSWLVYDLFISAKGPETLWIRGAISLSSSYETRNQILGVCLLLFPFLVILAGCGGWLITKSAFAPVSLIRRTAAEIENSGDLSKRIQLQGSKDEIYDLAQTFDYMLDRLQHSFQAERQFTADASHELRTPVAVILAHAEYGLAQAGNEPEMADALQVIWQQAKKMNTLISSLLLLARADQQAEKLRFETVNLSELAEMAADEVRVLAQPKQITIESEIEAELVLLADETSMLRLLLNLLQNAVRYGREGGWIKLTLRRGTAGIDGIVADNGIGIAPEHIDKIWRRFYQADPSRKRGEQFGSGLGLPIVKWIIECHGGSVSVVSQPGQGTQFHFFLPLRPPRHGDNGLS
ncbi:MAG: ATP-binding protein [Sporomusaceae bacterium]|nr:ATP-binding protein [Sporomusaceae bacterium]